MEILELLEKIINDIPDIVNAIGIIGLVPALAVLVVSMIVPVFKSIYSTNIEKSFYETDRKGNKCGNWIISFICGMRIKKFNFFYGY